MAHLKLPKTFRKKKNLEEKTKQLIESPKIHAEPSLDSAEKIVEMAKEVAEVNGLAKYPFSQITCTQGYFFEDDRLRIHYLICFEKWTKREKNHNVTVAYKGEIVLEYFSGDLKCLEFGSDDDKDDMISVYSIGNWEEVLREIYANNESAQESDFFS